MTSDSARTRHSDVVYVLAKLRARGDDYLLLNAHRKWGDWTLVGGHVESTDANWHAAATREAQEEMVPLRHDDDFELEAMAPHATTWGPVPSRSTGNQPTRYRTRWFALRFRTDPRTCLVKLSQREFRLVRTSDVPTMDDISSIVVRAANLTRNWQALPLSWDEALDELPLMAGQEIQPR